MILTRYLYRKHDVMRSLVWALRERNAKRAQFWADELTASGFGDVTQALVAEHGGGDLTQALVAEHENVPPPPLRSWQRMRNGCVYPHDLRVLPVADDIPVYMNAPCQRETYDITTMLHQRWLYYASFSPFWQARIHAFGGHVLHATRDVVFDDADEEEEFWEAYDLEPDEQPKHIQMHVFDHAYVLVERAAYFPRVVKVRRPKPLTVKKVPNTAPLLDR